MLLYVNIRYFFSLCVILGFNCGTHLNNSHIHSSRCLYEFKFTATDKRFCGVLWLHGFSFFSFHLSFATATSTWIEYDCLDIPLWVWHSCDESQRVIEWQCEKWKEFKSAGDTLVCLFQCVLLPLNMLNLNENSQNHNTHIQIPLREMRFAFSTIEFVIKRVATAYSTPHTHTHKYSFKLNFCSFDKL